MERINDYAALSGHTSSPALSALNHHYGPGATREPKDVESVWLVRDATRELGGSRAVNCKSGKDRTAMEIAISFTQVWGWGMCSHRCGAWVHAGVGRVGKGIVGAVIGIREQWEVDAGGNTASLFTEPCDCGWHMNVALLLPRTLAANCVPPHSHIHTHSGSYPAAGPVFFTAACAVPGRDGRAVL